MGWPGRRERLKWYARHCVLAAVRCILSAAYYVPALVLSNLGVRFLVSRAVMPNFGHLALDPQLYVKSERIGGHPRYRAVMLAPRWTVAN